MNLTRLTMPGGLEQLGSYAFSGCEALSSLALPDSLCQLGSNPFSGCSSLAELSISDDHPVFALQASALIDQRSQLLVTYLGGRGEAFAVVPEGVRRIGKHAFRGCTQLRSVGLPASLLSIGAFAFHGCFRIKRVYIPDALETIGAEAFYGCGSIDALQLPESITAIDSGAFEDCPNLTLSVEPGTLAEAYAQANNIPCSTTVQEM